MELSGWHIKQDGCVYAGGGAGAGRSSAIVAWPGDPVSLPHGGVAALGPNEVLTANGTVYVLGDMDPAVAEPLRRMCPDFNPRAPLARGSEAAVLLAERLAYGAAAARVAALSALLADLEDDVCGCGGPALEAQAGAAFDGIRAILFGMGMACPPRRARAPAAAVAGVGGAGAMA
jgi:hypothetical protein